MDLITIVAVLLLSLTLALGGTRALLSALFSLMMRERRSFEPAQSLSPAP